MGVVVLLPLCLLIYPVYSQAYDASTSLNCCPQSPAILSCFNGEFNITATPETKVYWFQLDLNQDQSVEFSTCKSDFDTQTEVWTSSKLISTSYCSSQGYDNDDCGGCGKQERYTIPDMQPGTYYIYVGWIHHVTGYTGSPVGPTQALSIETTGCISSPPTKSPTINPTTLTLMPTTSMPTTSMPTTSMPTTSMPTTLNPTTLNPTTSKPTTIQPTTSMPSTNPTTNKPSTISPTTSEPSTSTTSITSTASITSSTSISSITSITSTTATSSINIGKWRILFKLILRNILGLNPIKDTVDSNFIDFIENITKYAIYVQITSSNAEDDNVSIDDFEISVSSLKDMNDGIDFTLKSSTNDESLSIKIENALKNNFDDIMEYILNELKAYLGDPSNGFDNINTENVSLQIMNISDDLSVSISSTMITSTLSTENVKSSSSSSSSRKTATMTDIYFIGAVSIVAFCIILTICCFMKWSRKRKGLKNKNELEIMPTKQTQHVAPSSPSSGSNVQNGYHSNMSRNNTDNTEQPENIKKSTDAMSGFSSDNDVICDGDLHTNFVNMINNGDNVDYDSDPQEIHQIQQTIQIQQQRWIEQQIKKQQQQQQNEINTMNTMNKMNKMDGINKMDPLVTTMMNQLLASLPKPPSEVLLGGQYTARMSMDPNGVPDLLNVDDQSEMDAYHEGIDDGIDDAINNNQIDDDYDDYKDIQEPQQQQQQQQQPQQQQEEQQQQIVDNYNGYNDYDDHYGQSEQKQATVEYNEYNENNEYNEYKIDNAYNEYNKENEYNAHNFQLPEQPQVNHNVFQTPGEQENSDSNK